MTKVFVGNFSFAIDDEQLREHFASFGTVVSAKVMREGEGGRSRGFGFVEFSNSDEAQNAIRELDGTTWDGRVIKVSEDRSERRGSDAEGERGERGERGHDRGGYDRGGGRGGPRQSTGYFRAQPLDLGFRRRKKVDPFEEDENLRIDYKDAKLLSRFMSERGRILPRRMTGLTSANQRQISRAIKRAQHLAILPYRRG